MRLNVGKSVLLSGNSLNEDMVDVAMILFYGASVIDNTNLPQELLEKCIIGQLLGKPAELDIFVKQRYSFVSRITGGSVANDMGHLCESFVEGNLVKLLPSTFIVGGHSVKGISHNGKNLTTFDLVVTNSGTQKCCAIEISFQVTTNSVIGRKSGLAKSRKELLTRIGHKVAYIIDGSGNFQRKNAIATILQFSDRPVNFSDAGLAELVTFITKNLS